ncbi:MAG: serine acetyltransferase [Clostridiales bacterium]|nr:serine acetyltransferase [Clostridiales bacterium]
MSANINSQKTIEDAENIVKLIMADYQKGRNIDKKDDFYDQPSKEVIIDIIDKLMKIVYPGYFHDRAYKSYNAENHLATLIEDVMYRLHKQIVRVGKFSPDYENVCQEKLEHKAYQITLEFFHRIPMIREYLEGDLEAALEGDPAAQNFDEIILAYPGLYAITVNRLAHELFLLNVPLIPRIMAEHAHSLTGIDIHPGATIGWHFFIDHGTGIVVGETTVIGDNVKVYQGVTLGALSTKGGQKLRHVRRHPTIEDNVTIYSGASILGGETVIGRDSVIGSNAFVTKSIPAGTRVSIRQQELQFSGQKKSGGNEFSDDTWFYII